MQGARRGTRSRDSRVTAQAAGRATGAALLGSSTSSHSETISGDWYSILLASDIKEKIEENGSMRVFVKDIEVLSNSSLIFTMHTKVNGKCTKISLICNKTEKDGEYDVVHDGYNLFRIIETAYEDYIIFHLNNVNQEQEFQLMELYGRKPDVSPKVKEKFVRYCQGMEIPKENILDLTQVDRCLQARQSEAAQVSSAE
uniref:Lipocalin/cytosolic fatty-acid binding domain-containing protein n=1 Tax=Canis lupus familiaris TaxID=9615 RepID=A0A8P0P6M1_CANLF